MIENFSLISVAPILTLGIITYLIIKFIVDVIRGKYRSE